MGGLYLAADLARELARVGELVVVPFEAPHGRLAFLRAYALLIEATRALGLGRVVAAEVWALLSAGEC